MELNSELEHRSAEEKFQQKINDEAALSPEKQWAGRIRPYLEAGVAGFIAAGLELIEAKRALKKQRGTSFVHMVEAELGENIDAVQKWMAIARNPFFTKTANLRFLPTAWTTLYVLCPLKQQVLEDLVEVGRLHPALTGAEAVAAYGLSTAPPKDTDKRAFTGETCQAEALAPDVLAGILRSAIEARIDRRALDRVLQREQRVQRELGERLRHV